MSSKLASMVIVLAQLSLFHYLASCSEDSNINAIFIPESKTNNINDLLDEAESLYDKGEYAAALTAAQKAYELSPNNEEVAILLSYIHLSVAGIDSFQLARNLIDQSSTTTTTLTTQDTSCSSETGAVAALCKLGSTIGLSATDKNNLTTEATGTTDYRFPKKASEARAAGVLTIDSMKNAINIVCPLVKIHSKLLTDDDRAAVAAITGEETKEYASGAEVANTRTTSDSRHTTTNCTPNTFASSALRAKAHYIWSFAHLVEGIAFYAVFSENIAPLATAMTNLSSTDTSASGITTFLSQLSNITTAIDTMMPTDATASADSMLTGIFNNLEAASRGFSQIDGMPTSITESITEAVAGLKKSMESITSSAGDASAAAMKDQLTSTITTELQSKITNADGSLSTLGTEIAANAENKAAFCSSYSEISTSTITGLCD